MAGLVVVVIVGLVIGLEVLWIAGVVVLLLLLMGAFAVPQNVQRLNVPPWGFFNAPGDVTHRDRERRD